MHSDIQTSKVTLNNINRLNHYVMHTSRLNATVNVAYETKEFYTKERYTNKDPWKYKINKYGFRGDDWDFKKSPAFFGCSCTFGIGVEKPASMLMQEKFKDRIIPNLGIPGGSAISIIRLFSSFARLHPMSHAFITLPPLERFFFPVYENNDWLIQDVILGFDMPSIDKKTMKQISNIWLGKHTNISYALDYIDWAEDIAKIYDIKIYWSSWDKPTFNFLKEIQKNNTFKWPKYNHSDSRDGAHPGKLNHTDLANNCWNIL